MRWPGKIPAGTETAEPMMTIDLLPTFAGIVGTGLPKLPIDGKDAWPLISGQPGAKSPQEVYYFYYENNQFQALTTERWKLQLPHTYRTLGDQPRATGGKPVKYSNVTINSPELYAVQKDIGEKTNVASENAAELSRLLAIGDNMRAELGDSLTKTKGTGNREPGRVDAAK
jgi:arylsulfatase A-like enzyme